MSLNRVFDIASSAMYAQSKRLNAVASNLANAESATSSDGQPYRAKQVVFEAVLMDKQNAATTAGVRVKQVVESTEPPRMMYAPHNPLADKNGYVAMPNVNPVEEMTNMIAASRAYQTNADVMNTTKTLMQKTLTIGQG